MRNKTRKYISILLSLAFVLCLAFPSGAMAESFGTGDHYWGGVTFTGENGGSYKTIYGNHLKVKVAFKAVDSSPYSYTLNLNLLEYPGYGVFNRTYTSWGTTPDSDGYYYYESEWFDIDYGVDYRFWYTANSSCNCVDPRRLTVYIWIEVS